MYVTSESSASTASTASTASSAAESSVSSMISSSESPANCTVNGTAGTLDSAGTCVVPGGFWHGVGQCKFFIRYSFICFNHLLSLQISLLFSNTWTNLRGSYLVLSKIQKEKND